MPHEGTYLCAVAYLFVRLILSRHGLLLNLRLWVRHLCRDVCRKLLEEVEERAENVLSVCR